MTDILDPEYKLTETLAREKEEETLSDRADKIILQNVYTDKDIFDLCKIKRELTKLYWKALDLATWGEHNYNITRASLTGVGAVTTQENSAKLNAEKKYGSRRGVKAFAQIIKAKIDAINTVCIQYNVTQKGMRDASMTQDDF